MDLNNKRSKAVILSSISLIIVGILISINIGEKQDDVFLQDQTKYNISIEKLQQGEYPQAYQTISEIVDKYNGSESVNYVAALTAFNVGEVEKASRYSMRALDLNPYKVEDPMFMLQLAQILTGAGKTEEATIVLERCKTLKAPEDYPQYHDMVAQLQQSIEPSL